MTSQLPAFPKLVFTIIEPISLLAAFIVPMIDTPWFITSQMSFAYTSVTQQAILTNVIAHDATTQLLTKQLGNAYLLLGLLGVFVLRATTETKVVDAYLWALWLGDIGHVGLSLYAYGWQGMLDYGNWGAAAWGNTLFTVFLFVVRSLYFAGFFTTTNEDSKAKGKALKDKVELERAKRA